MSAAEALRESYIDHNYTKYSTQDLDEALRVFHLALRGELPGVILPCRSISLAEPRVLRWSENFLPLTVGQWTTHLQKRGGRVQKSRVREPREIVGPYATKDGRTPKVVVEPPILVHYPVKGESGWSRKGRINILPHAEVLKYYGHLSALALAGTEQGKLLPGTAAAQFLFQAAEIMGATFVPPGESARYMIDFPLMWHFCLSVVASAGLNIRYDPDSQERRQRRTRKEKVEHVMGLLKEGQSGRGLRRKSRTLQKKAEEYHEDWLRFRRVWEQAEEMGIDLSEEGVQPKLHIVEHLRQLADQLEKEIGEDA